jgi:hypothetical protein
MKKVLSILLSLFVLLSVSSIGLADSTETDDAEAIIAANRILADSTGFISSEFGDYDKITLSEPMECYALGNHIDSWVQAYTAKSLSPLYSTTEYRMFYVYGDGEPITRMLLNDWNGSWGLADLGGDLQEILDAQEKLAAAIPEATTICSFWIGRKAYVFTPDLSNGYIMAVNGEDDTIYRTRDLLIEYYKQTKDIDYPTTFEELKANAAQMGEAEDDLIFLPQQTHSVLLFWCAVIGIPVVVVATAVILILVIRKKKVK